MIGINQQVMSAKTLKPHNLSKAKNYVSQDQRKMLNKSLLALAILGLATMSSCSKDDYLGEQYDTQFKTEEVSKSHTLDEYIERKTTYEQTTEIMKTLGILVDEHDSLDNVQTISCRDSEGSRYSIKPTTVYDNYITGKGIKILSNDSADEVYTFIIKNSNENGVNFIKTYDNGITDTFNYVLGDDDTVIEYRIISDNYKLENSKYKKLDDGSLERTFYDGTTKIYNNISRNEPYPTPIVFGAEVQDYDDIVNNTDI